MEIVRTTLADWLSGAIEGNIEVVAKLRDKLTEDREKPQMLASHMSWASNAVRAAARAAVYDGYLDYLNRGLDVHDTSTVEKQIEFYTLLRTQIMKDLMDRSRDVANTSSMPTSNETEAARLEAISRFIGAIDWVLMELNSKTEEAA